MRMNHDPADGNNSSDGTSMKGGTNKKTDQVCWVFSPLHEGAGDGDLEMETDGGF